MLNTMTRTTASDTMIVALVGENKTQDNIAKLPKDLGSNFLEPFAKLSSEQAGYLRHFHNLATQQDGEWIHMGSQEPGQEWVDAYRYQLATMAYAAGLCYYHRTPALRSVMKKLIEQLIHKMLLRDVWGYWFLTSHSGVFVDPSLKELRRPWADPLKKENIMYSGHLLLMTSLHAMLFNDDKYDKPEALVFHWNPVFWGMGPETFTYNITSLQDIILKEMESENRLGVCCEPNSIFVVCNQFPMIAFRYNDVRKGTKTTEDVPKKYLAAWEKFGFIQEDGLWWMFYSVKQKSITKTPSIGSTAWSAAFMNAWNPEMARSSWRESLGFLSRVESDRVNLNTDTVAHSFRVLVKSQGMDPDAPETLEKARENAKSLNFFDIGYTSPTFGYVMQWASEIGDRETLEGLINHASKYLNPTIERGGLFYPRNDKATDNDYNFIQVDPYTGNAAIAYGCLNIQDGQRKMYTKPWTKEQVERMPYIDNIDLSSDIDYLRGAWNEDLGALVLTMRTWNGSKKDAEPRFCKLGPGRFGIYVGGKLLRIQELFSMQEVISVEVEVCETEVDIVVLKAT